MLTNDVTYNFLTYARFLYVQPFNYPNLINGSGYQNLAAYINSISFKKRMDTRVFP